MKKKAREGRGAAHLTPKRNTRFYIAKKGWEEISKKLAERRRIVQMMQEIGERDE